MSDAKDLADTLLNFEKRAKAPSQYPYITNPDGGISTHRMSAEIDEDGRIYAFPTIVQMPDGRLKHFENNFDALRYNKSTGNLKEFDDINAALEYSRRGMKNEYPQLEAFGKEERRKRLADILLETK